MAAPHVRLRRRWLQTVADGVLKDCVVLLAVDECG